MEKKFAEKVLKDVRTAYNTIAKEWNISRNKLRESRMPFLKSIPKGAHLLDIGCGNGIVYEFLAKKSISYTGIDISKKLIAYARRRVIKVNTNASVNFKVASATALPFHDKSFSHIVCYAVLHHIPSKPKRVQAVNEMFRVIKPGGKICVTVWNLFSDYARSCFDIDNQFAHPDPNFDERDVIVLWKATPQKIVERYLHAFTLEELNFLFEEAGFKKVRSYFCEKKTGKKTDIRQGADIILTAIK